MPRLEFETLDKLNRHLDVSTDLNHAVFQSLDLNAVADRLATTSLQHNVLLGCEVSEALLQRFDQPAVFPTLPDVPFQMYRGALYGPDELLGGYQPGQPESYERTLDGQVYRHYVNTGKAGTQDVVTMLARRLHDHAMTDALHEFLVGRKVVAIMGGHAMRRDAPDYLKVARLSRDLVQAGYLPASGGGPGGMEATHLGAWFAARDDAELVEAVAMLSKAPLYDPMGPWLDTAAAVKQRYPLINPDDGRSLGIPTWLYGHEPPTGFATDIAKYFANSVREEGLLAIATYGVVFAPGSAGTIQEIFQDATQNHYRSFGTISPMVFLGERFWTQDKPVFPLLKQLATGHDYGQLLSVTDDRRLVMERIAAFTPETVANPVAKPVAAPPPAPAD